MRATWHGVPRLCPACTPRSTHMFVVRSPLWRTCQDLAASSHAFFAPHRRGCSNWSNTTAAPRTTVNVQYWDAGQPRSPPIIACKLQFYWKAWRRIGDAIAFAAAIADGKWIPLDRDRAFAVPEARPIDRQDPRCCAGGEVEIVADGTKSATLNP